jgi:hypothetical protein
MAHLNPTPKDVAHKIDAMREAFNSKYADNIKNGVYDDRDLSRMRTDTPYAGCFLRSLRSKADPVKAADCIHESLKFRKELGLGDLTAESFPEEITEKNAIYYKGTDLQGFPIMYVNVKENVAKSDQHHILKQYMAWNFDIQHKANPEQMCTVIMDLSGASVSNMNLDMTKFIIGCFTTYFPAFLSYVIIYDMSTFLSEQKQKLLMVKKSDIGKYIAPENQWPHMKKT